MEEKLLTTREASNLLSIPEQDVINLANSGEIPSIKLGGEYLRYRKRDILARKGMLKKKAHSGMVKRFANWREVLYFYDFYFVCGALIVVLMWIIVNDIHS